MNKNIVLLYQNVGTNWAIGIELPKEASLELGETARKEIEYAHNGFYNYDATGGELTFETDNFAWFWTQPERFEKGLVSMRRAAILNRFDKALGRDRDSSKDFTQTNPKIEEKALREAKEMMSKMRWERFLGVTSQSGDFFEQGETNSKPSQEE